MGTSIAAERARKERGERKRRWVSHSEKMPAMYTAYTGTSTVGRAGGRTYVREQFCGSVCHINRDGGGDGERQATQGKTQEQGREGE